ncbi:LPD29 domain-containing protein [Pseudoalteromonas sp. Of7M-16]|uniref:LPD29 domain-containing protein n=1 Tax=Pseudoalteromonas sp. Of7M-16 TaxID=2917756 RepID=UPI001EF643AB|nr:LPD29 domain-containing protein [Pseudoalteromonas sp. Of7M-16]MCG7548569.1 hypothetical protein [Pseudoalteromonas sp. Of7M-16]
MYEHLNQVSSNVSTEVAKNVRKDLKHHFPLVKFSVRKRGHGAIDVSWTDGPTTEQVESIVNKYQQGSFNGMEDIYEYSATEFNTIYGGVDYVFTKRSLSDETISKAIHLLKLEHVGSCDDIPTVDGYRRGEGLSTSPFDHFNPFYSWQRLITDKAGEFDLSNGFKPHLKAVHTNAGWFAEVNGAFITATQSTGVKEAFSKALQLI